MIEADKFLEATFILKSLENFILVKFYQALSIQSSLVENGLCRAIAVVWTVADTKFLKSSDLIYICPTKQNGTKVAFANMPNTACFQHSF